MPHDLTKLAAVSRTVKLTMALHDAERVEAALEAMGETNLMDLATALANGLSEALVREEREAHGIPIPLPIPTQKNIAQDLV